jgi:hypothetical protein
MTQPHRQSETVKDLTTPYTYLHSPLRIPGTNDLGIEQLQRRTGLDEPPSFVLVNRAAMVLPYQMNRSQTRNRKYGTVRFDKLDGSILSILMAVKCAIDTR